MGVKYAIIHMDLAVPSLVTISRRWAGACTMKYSIIRPARRLQTTSRPATSLRLVAPGVYSPERHDEWPPVKPMPAWVDWAMLAAIAVGALYFGVRILVSVVWGL